MSRGDSTRTRRSGARLALITILLLLLVLLAGLVYFIISMLSPVGAPESASLPEGIEWVRSIYGFGPNPDQQLVAPDHTAIAPDGTIWVSDTQLAAVIGFNADGSFSRMISLSELVEEGSSIPRPKGLDFGEDGTMYVCCTSVNRLFVFSSSGEFMAAWELSGPLDCTVHEERLYVTGQDGVTILGLDGEWVGAWGGRGKELSQLDLPQGVEVAEDGTVYVSDTLNSRIKAFTPDGELLWTTGAGVEGGGSRPMSGIAQSSESTEAGTGVQLPTGITVDGRGRIVFADAFSFELVVVDPVAEGDIVNRYGSFGNQDGFFLYPTDVDYDPEHDWFVVADTANGRVQILRLPDSGTGEIAPAVRRALVGPVWICVLPLLLLAAVGLGSILVRRRDARADAQMQVPDETAADSGSL